MGYFKKIAQKSEIAEGKVKSIETKFIRIGLVNLGGEIFAFEDLCTHDGEIISGGKLEGDVITCPRHFAKFNVRDGKVLCMPATSPLPTLKVRVAGEDVEVELED
ncbi:MAG: non-heme iron oxygenase ferredoxin subunit [Leptospira sp.]|nr:non-heme iron oxygenase ferredoxin subunit [Leptospira sp.]